MKTNPPRFIPPMLALKTSTLPKEDALFAYEVKWDGMRCLAYCHSGRLTLYSRNGRDATFQYPELNLLIQTYPKLTTILDGEIIVTNADGQPDFALMQERMTLKNTAKIQLKAKSLPVSYMIFDILFLDGKSLLTLTYQERRAILEALGLNGTHWQTPRYQAGNGELYLAATKKLKLEGVVAKRLDSPYRPGERSGEWLKIKNLNRQEFVIGGFLPGEGSRAKSFGSLLVGYYPEKAKLESYPILTFAGAVGSGFNQKLLTTLTEAFQQLKTPVNPFLIQPHPNAQYLKPVLIAEVEFTEWTPAHTLRHPVFKGLRQDKPPLDVTKET